MGLIFGLLMHRTPFDFADVRAVAFLEIIPHHDAWTTALGTAGRACGCEELPILSTGGTDDQGPLLGLGCHAAPPSKRTRLMNALRDSPLSLEAGRPRPARTSAHTESESV